MKAIPLEVQVYSFIKQSIQSCEYIGILPSERKIADEYGVSRPVVRKALERLRSEGIICTSLGRGSEVTATPARKSSLGLVMPESAIRFWASFLSAFKERLEPKAWQIKIYPYGSWDDTDVCTEMLDLSFRENVFRENAAVFVHAPSQPDAAFIKTAKSLHNAGFPVLYFGLPCRGIEIDVMDYRYDIYVRLGRALLEKPEYNQIAFAIKSQDASAFAEELVIEELEKWFASESPQRVYKKILLYNDDEEGIATLAKTIQQKKIDILCPIEGMSEENIKKLGINASSVNMRTPGIPRIEFDQGDLASVAADAMRKIIIEGVGCRRMWIEYSITEL